MTGSTTSPLYKPRDFPDGTPAVGVDQIESAPPSPRTPRGVPKKATSPTNTMQKQERGDIARLADMLVHKCEYAPTENMLYSLWSVAPRFSVPVFADALISASIALDVNAAEICQLVAHTLDLALKIVIPNHKAHAPQLKTWQKHVQQITLGVVRTVATPGQRAGATENWSRAVYAAQFCMGTRKHAVASPPSAPADMIWRLLSRSTCATQTSNNIARRAANWYGMMTRVAISLTPVGMWQEAHAAMRTQGNLVKEVVTQTKLMEKLATISETQIAIARSEMCMGNAKEREGEDEDEMPIDGLDEDFVFASLLGDGMGNEGLDGLPSAEDVTALPSWCVAAVPPTTPPKATQAKPPTPRTNAEGKRTVPLPMQSDSHLEGTLKGYFRVTVSKGGLSPPINLIKEIKKKAPARARKVTPVVQSARALNFCNDVASLLCYESSEELLATTKTWKPYAGSSFHIENGAYKRRTYNFNVTPMRSLPINGALTPLVPSNLSMVQAMALCY